MTIYTTSHSTATPNPDPARALVLAILNALIAEADKAYTAMERI